MAKRKAIRSTEGLTTLDDFLREQGKLEEFKAVAVAEGIERGLSDMQAGRVTPHKGAMHHLRAAVRKRAKTRS